MGCHYVVLRCPAMAV
ncbi:rCG62498 [Rattus norvegicus]|uniref:RCG62498 n=1 Tax=Rattus norvegicus TaxID=10116 RepID=A6J6B1_RAT|nr:rCG62498 [Rattus norvegicus]